MATRTLSLLYKYYVYPSWQIPVQSQRNDDVRATFFRALLKRLRYSNVIFTDFGQVFFALQNCYCACDHLWTSDTKGLKEGFLPNIRITQHFTSRNITAGYHLWVSVLSV